MSDDKCTVAYLNSISNSNTLVQVVSTILQMWLPVWLQLL